MPESAVVFRAIDIYLHHAYARGIPPKAVQARVEQLRRTDPAELFSCPVLEHDRKNPASQRHVLRLGNRFYPHMKLCIEPRPDRQGYLFRADTHDRHVRPPEGSKDAALFNQIVEQNAALSKEIEAAWAEAGVPTFRTYLKEDLARRKGGAA
jgi:hypothetical protein